PVRAAGISALAPLVPFDAALRGRLLAALEDDVGEVRQRAITALGPLLSADAEVRARLLGMIQDPEPGVRSATLRTLGPYAPAPSGCGGGRSGTRSAPV